MRRIKMDKSDIDKCVVEFKDFLQNEKDFGETEQFKYEIRPPRVEGEEKAQIIFSERAYTKIILLVEGFNCEVAWHGVAHRLEKGKYRIEDIIVYPQYVTGVTVTTDPLELAYWEEKVPGEVYNNLSFQGHSHVKMPVNPSGTDLRDQREYLKELKQDEFYIFAIFNKHYDVYFKLYDMKYDICYEDEDIEYSVDGIDMGEFLDEAKGLVRSRYYTSPEDIDDYYDRVTEEYYDEREDYEDGLQ